MDTGYNTKKMDDSEGALSERDSDLWHQPEVGMASVEPKVATYTEFAEVVLPRIKSPSVAGSAGGCGVIDVAVS